MRIALRPRLHRSVVRPLLIFAAVGSCYLAFADTRTITFKNDEGVTVDDLHIVYDNATTTNTATPFTSERVSPDTKTHNHWNGSVPNGNTATVKFTTANGVNATIKDWWWTIGGNATADGAQQGNTHHDDGGAVLSVSGGNATGTGQVRVTVGANTCTFQTTAGRTALQTANDFVAFVNSTSCGNPSFAYAIQGPGSTACALSNTLTSGTPVPAVLQVLVADGGQGLTIQSAFTKVPALGTVGMVLLIGFLALAALVLLRRNRTAAA